MDAPNNKNKVDNNPEKGLNCIKLTSSIILANSIVFILESNHFLEHTWQHLEIVIAIELSDADHVINLPNQSINDIDNHGVDNGGELE